ncbi:MAG TPA: GNAT family N-acetyltransferase [Thermoanaerobaculia bacterium]|nr:GNAT family N-acetyltransferase [Thermoanaerobaculia bacterium]
MIRAATLEDLPLIRQILSSSDAPYDAAAVAEEKCFGRGIDGEPETLLAEDKAVAVRCGGYLRLLCVAREHRRQGIGSELLRRLAPRVIAAEPGNYFTPGVLDSDHGSIAFLERHGFAPGTSSWNLHASLSGGQAILPVPGDRTGRIACPPQNLLLDFVEREFGAVWRFEAARGAACFWIPDVAFAVVEANNRGLGTFGPAGVVEKMRGRGHGREVLLAALSYLRARGFTRAVIPWTGAIEFYRRSCGAEPAHRFVTYTSRP